MFSRKFLSIALLIACASGIPEGRAQTLGCLIEPSKVADVGSEVIGILEKLLVERGDMVTKGQPTAELDAKVERAALSAARARAKAMSELKAAHSNHQFAKRKKDRTEDLFNKKFVSEQTNDQAATESQIAELRYKQAKEQQDVAERELELAQAQLARRTIRSPITGVVIERFLSAGERVEQKPLMRIAAIDPLYVEVFVSASHYNSIQVGGNAIVRPEIAGFEDRSGKVILVDRVIDPASNTFRVRIELANPNGALPPGVRCKADFTGKGFDSPSTDNSRAGQVARKK
ncbi:MAG: efflux RND transporter periplasmic adaptor subunit [Burkholderiales bacterium]